MNKLGSLLFTLLVFGCSSPESNNLNLNPGEAVLTINNIEYNAAAIFGTRILGETEFEQISLIVSDSIQIDILNKKFEKEVITWAGETFTSAGTMVFLSYSARGGYGPTGGFLIISDLTDATISGRFDMELYNFASSCSDCPENEVTAEGQFVAVME